MGEPLDDPAIDIETLLRRIEGAERQALEATARATAAEVLLAVLLAREPGHGAKTIADAEILLSRLETAVVEDAPQPLGQALVLTYARARETLDILVLLAGGRRF